MYLISDLKYYITLGKFEIFICKFHLTSLNSENESSLYIARIAWFIARISIPRLAKNPFQEKTEKLPD